MRKFEIVLVGLLAAALAVRGQSGSASSSSSAKSGSGNSVPKADSDPIASASTVSASSSARAGGVGFGAVEPEPAIPGISGNLNVQGGIPFIPGLTHGFNTGFNLNMPGLETLATLSSLLGGDASATGSAGGLGAAPLSGLMGPAYFPKTWLGSAFGAKGDILFPAVIGIFFLVGLWTVIQFVLEWLVPMVAEKLDKINRPTDPLTNLLTPKTGFLRDVTSAQLTLNPAVAELSRQVAECIEKGAIKYESA